MSAGAAQTAIWAAGRCSARAGGRSEEGPPARAVLAPVPSSPRAPEPPWSPFRASLGGPLGRVVPSEGMGGRFLQWEIKTWPQSVGHQLTIRSRVRTTQTTRPL